MQAFEGALLGGSFVLGLTHAFEVDHMTAVSAFVATNPRPRAAAAFGAKWATGHGISLLIFGSALFALKLAVTPTVAEVFERLVGVALLLLGVWSLYQLRRKVVPEVRHHHHVHPHTYPHDHSHSHEHGAVWMGVLHGIAGTAAFVGQAIVVAAQSYFFVLLYTLAFSLGVVASMVVFGGALGVVIRRMGRSLQLLMALWACGVGVVWILGLN